jgi:hypothetical protein
MVFLLINFAAIQAMAKVMATPINPAKPVVKTSLLIAGIV